MSYPNDIVETDKHDDIFDKLYDQGFYKSNRPDFLFTIYDFAVLTEALKFFISSEIKHV